MLYLCSLQFAQSASEFFSLLWFKFHICDLGRPYFLSPWKSISFPVCARHWSLFCIKRTQFGSEFIVRINLPPRCLNLSAPWFYCVRVMKWRHQKTKFFKISNFISLVHYLYYLFDDKWSRQVNERESITDNLSAPRWCSHNKQETGNSRVSPPGLKIRRFSPVTHSADEEVIYTP